MAKKSLSTYALKSGGTDAEQSAAPQTPAPSMHGTEKEADEEILMHDEEYDNLKNR